MPDLRFKNFAFFHEDFSSGHLFEAAVAHYQATGKKTLLTVATRLADLFDREFGPGKKDYIRAMRASSWRWSSCRGRRAKNGISISLKR